MVRSSCRFTRGAAAVAWAPAILVPLVLSACLPFHREGWAESPDAYPGGGESVAALESCQADVPEDVAGCMQAKGWHYVEFTEWVSLPPLPYGY